MSRLRIAYLVLTVLGGTVPMFYFIRWFDANGWSLAGLVAAWNVTDATTGLVYDLTITAAALAIFIAAETAARRDWWVLVCIPLIFVVGVSFAFPLYLFLRSRPVA